MSAKITISSVTFDLTPGISQVATIKYKKQSDPDSSFITVSTNAIIAINGTLNTPVVIDNLLNGINYVVRVSDNCNNTPIDKVFSTPLLPCVQLTDIIGTTEPE